MHEFSIIQNIIDIVTDSAIAHNVAHVQAVEVNVGKASGVVREAMDFAWEAATKDTFLNKAVLKINEIPIVVRCTACNYRYEPAEVFEICPQCGEVNPEVLSGRELRVVSIET